MSGEEGTGVHFLVISRALIENGSDPHIRSIHLYYELPFWLGNQENES